MITADFDRRGLPPFRLQRFYRQQGAAIWTLTGVYEARVRTIVFLYLDSPTHWWLLRRTCSRLFIFFSNPTSIRDPPVAVEFGPHSDPGESDSAHSDPGESDSN